MTLGEMIKQYRERFGMSQRDFANKSGMSNVMISYIERNENPRTGKPINLSYESYYKIAEALGIDITEMFKSLDLASVNLLPSNIKTINEMSLKSVPLIGSVAAGEPILAEENHEAVILAPGNADYALEIKGESMMPTYLPGDIIYIRKQPDIDHNGQVAVVLLDDEATVKHVYKQKDGLMLISDNPAYEPMFKRYIDFDTIRILGKVCGFTRMYK